MTDTMLMIEQLQTKSAFQDDLIMTLNDRVSVQEKEIQVLNIQLAHLVKKMKSLELSSQPDDHDGMQLPPHY
ncbi:MAG: hypothetical protein COA42_00040 [Alteromonadaceae bacterium]|nr:MAG: hypothetical protein COA42_00040 [Alteromonadaceae bacterium]